MPEVNSPSPKLRIAVVGGGVGGLCLAIALSRYPDLQVDVYEAVEDLVETGPGVIFWERAWRVVCALGIAEDLVDVASAPIDPKPNVGFEARRSDAPGEGSRFACYSPPFGSIKFHRAHLLAALAKHLPEGTAHLKKRVTSYSETGDGVSLTFADGTTASADVLLGCDGIKSVIRRQMYEAEAGQGKPELLRFIKPTWSGTMIYHALVPAERLLQVCDGRRHRVIDDATMYCGKNKHIFCFTVGKAAPVVNIVGFQSDPDKEGTPYEGPGPWASELPADEFRNVFRGWEPECQEILSCIDFATVEGLQSLKPLPFYISSKVALLGDAAHAMLPHQSVGDVLAIEDAYIMARLLADPIVTKETLSHALHAYQAVRLPFANAGIKGARTTGLMSEFNSEHMDNYKTLGPALEKQWAWLGANTTDEEVEEALSMMKASISSTMMSTPVSSH